MKEGFRAVLLLPVLILITLSCSLQRRIEGMEKNRMTAALSLPAGNETFIPDVRDVPARYEDTLRVTGLDGKEVLIMRAVKDDSTGEMVATEQLDAAVVTARFRNVSERHGKVDLRFRVTVPRELHDSKWQIRLHPDMKVLDDSVRLEDVIITGADYRKTQLRGYQQYQRFLNRIVTDTLAFVRMHELEVFLERNLPEVYAFRTDSNYVSDEAFASVFGVTQKEAVDHYTNILALRWNEHRKERLPDKLKRFVKSPIVTDGIRLDTVIHDLNGDFIYDYVQSVNVVPRLRKVDVTLCGEIFEADKRLYLIPGSDPLSFYISSVSAFVDGTPRFLTKVVSRNLEAHTTSYIDFRLGSSAIEPELSGNALEIRNIKRTLNDLLSNPEFVLDSIVTVAWASPEGTARSNALLTRRRAQSVSDYFARYMDHVLDSLRIAGGFRIDYDGEGETVSAVAGSSHISFISRSGGENWTGLDDMVITDTTMSDALKQEYFALAGGCHDLDDRERRLSTMEVYPHIKNDLYPRLRTVVFDFHLHRPGMIKDTVCTTVLDSAYMAGVQAVRDHDYERGAELLGPYQDFNTAIAYVALDRNLSAMSILKDCPRTPTVEYMMALVHSRLGDERSAVECYLHACRQDPSFVHRGNLDPEISSLIKKYGLNAAQDE